MKMIAPPDFTSVQEFRARLGDVEFWRPCVADVLQRHDLFDSDIEIVAGHNPTNPTFIAGDVVVKLFGYSPEQWRMSHAAELAAQRLITTDPGISAPRLLADGRLFDGAGAPWPYLVTTRMPGVAMWRAELSDEQQRSLARELGRQVRRIHALPPAGVMTERDWPAGDVAEANRHGSLPPHLVAQIDRYLSSLEPFEQVVVNSDIVANHVYVDDGKFVGIIDWGDTMVTDRHVELIQFYRDTFDCDKSLFRAFLEASEWPVDQDFPRKAMGHAIRRQAIGMAQHGRIDVFEPIAAKYPLHDIPTLDDLATLLFDV